MKAVLCRQLGSLDCLVIDDVGTPDPGQGQVRVSVMAAGVNFLDGLRVLGKYQEKAELPFTPGAEIAGIVSALGEDVESIAIGDRVMAYVGTGGFAEEAVVDVGQIMKIPAAVDFNVAGGFTIAYGTSLHALENIANLKRDETLLVLGAAGGAGLAAVATGKAMGARVIAAASSAEKLELCRRCGADALIDYGTEDFRVALQRTAGKASVNVVFDPVGGRLTEPAFRALTWRGRYLVVGFAAGEIPKLPINLALLMERQLAGVYWGAWRKREPLRARAGLLKGIRWVADGKIAPIVGSVHPLERAADALDELLRRQARGKTIVAPRSIVS